MEVREAHTRPRGANGDGLGPNPGEAEEPKKMHVLTNAEEILAPFVAIERVNLL